MARILLAPVGRLGGLNLPGDVKNVQELLNNVPVQFGGPRRKLKVDSICGPKTIQAIQEFQIRHFGWPGADGRVDPLGPTLMKLNTFDTPPDPDILLSRNASLTCPHLGPIIVVRPTSPKYDRRPLRIDEPYRVVFCPNPLPPFGPCVSVRWLASDRLPFLTINSSGLCFNAGNTPTGPIIINSR